MERVSCFLIKPVEEDDAFLYSFNYAGWIETFLTKDKESCHAEAREKARAKALKKANKCLKNQTNIET